MGQLDLAGNSNLVPWYNDTFKESDYHKLYGRDATLDASFKQQDVPFVTMPSEPTDNVTVSKENVNRPYACSYCGRRFKRKAHIANHIRLHTGDKPYVCNLCGAAFAQDSGLRYHKLSSCKNRSPSGK